MKHQQQETSRQASKTPIRSSEPAASVREDTPAVFQLQQALGNQGVLQMLRSGVLQAKLSVSRPDDVYEQEADRVAEQVMGMSDSAISSQQSGVISAGSAIQTKSSCSFAKDSSCGDEEQIQTKVNPVHVQDASFSTESTIESLRGGGQPLFPSLRAFSEPRFGHDFGKVHAHAGSREPIPANPMFQMRMSRQATLEEKETSEYSGHGLLISLAGSGTCVNGGGASVCDPTTGKYKITSNTNTCCTKDCTQEHEQRHVTDHDGWGCCAALSVAWGKKGADKGALVKKYNDWFAKANLISECNAYSNDVKCADALAKTKDCSGAGKGTDCCKDIADYQARYSALAKTYCAKAPKSVPPCPSF